MGDIHSEFQDVVHWSDQAGSVCYSGWSAELGIEKMRLASLPLGQGSPALEGSCPLLATWLAGEIPITKDISGVTLVKPEEVCS